MAANCRLSSTDMRYALLSSDEAFARLHQAGWSVGDTAVRTAAGRVWVVWGTNGENALEARGGTQAEAWHLACQQAEALGLLRRR